MTKNKLKNLSEFLRKKYENIDVPFFIENRLVGNHYCISIKNPNFDEEPILKHPNFEMLNTRKLYFHEDMTPYTVNEIQEIKGKYRQNPHMTMRENITTPVTDEKILAKFLLMGNSFDRKKQIITHLRAIIATIDSSYDVDYIESIYKK